MALEGILTAMVTPFRPDGRLDEEAAAAMARYLLDHGSGGLVLAGSTGEGSTLSDDEKCALFEIAVAEARGAPVIAGTGSNDTAHSVELTERAAALGVDAVLVVAPYYNKPNRRGLIEHFRAVASAGDVQVVLYNIPSRVVIDMPNDLLRELAEIPNVTAVKQARYEDLAPIEGLDVLAGNDDMLASVLDMGGPGGICVASHLVGPEMRRMIDEPENRSEIHESLLPLLEALGVTINPIPVKTALAMMGHVVGGFRLPMVEADAHERSVIRAGLERQRLLSAV